MSGRRCGRRAATGRRQALALRSSRLSFTLKSRLQREGISNSSICTPNAGPGDPTIASRCPARKDARGLFLRLLGFPGTNQQDLSGQIHDNAAHSQNLNTNYVEQGKPRQASRGPGPPRQVLVRPGGPPARESNGSGGTTVLLGGLRPLRRNG